MQQAQSNGLEEDYNDDEDKDERDGCSSDAFDFLHIIFFILHRVIIIE